MCSRPDKTHAPTQNHEICAIVIETWLGEDSLLKKYEKLEEECRNKLPYHINLIDLLRPKVNEPTHSRIFGELLKQKKKNEFQILNKFIKYLGDRKNGFRDITFKNPEIDPEAGPIAGHIDIWVRDKETGNALIIENKIHNAKDQDRQLFRYIETTERKGFRKENIYVVYLPRDGEKEPDNQSWGHPKKGYKKEFEGRYIKVTFRELLDWLNTVLPSTSNNEIFLRSALEQYIDHLEGPNMLQSGERFDTMNKKLKKLISNELHLEKLPADARLGLLAEKKGELDKMIKHLGEFEVEEAEKVFKNWERRIQGKYGERTKPVVNWEDGNGTCPYLNISFAPGITKKAFNVSVMRRDTVDWYYGITAMEGRLKDKASIKRDLGELNLEKEGFQLTHDEDLLCYAKRVEFNKAGECLNEIIALVEMIDSHLKKMKGR